MKFDFLRSLLDSSQDLLAVIDLDGTIVECNAAFARSAGLTWEETLGKKVEQFVSSKQRRNFTGTLKGAFSTGLSSDLRANFKSRNGISIPISWIVSPKISPNGRAELIILKGLDTREFDQITSRLTEAENQFEGFMDSLPGIAFIKDKSRRLTYVNKRFEEVFECKVADGIGRKDESFLPRAVAHRNKVIEEGLLNSGGYDVRIEEDEAVLNDRRWMIHRFAIGEGSERKIGGLSLEITQLNEAEEMFRAMADASTDAISILRPKRDAGGKVIDFSFNYLNALAHHVFSIENYGLDSFKQATKAEFPASVLPAIVRVVETGLPFEDEIKIGDPHYAQAHVQLQAVRAGDFVSLNLRDISSEIMASKLLQLASVRYKTLFEGNPAACMTLDLDAKVVDWNHKCQELYGYSVSEVKGKSIIDLVVGEEIRQGALDACAETHRTGGFHEGSEWRVKRKDGKHIWVFSSSIPLHDEDGILVGTVSTNIDITTLKETEALLRTSNSDLEQFANVASHDLLEPLRMVCCYLDLINSEYGDKLDEEGQQFLSFALDGGLRMREMIKSLLEYSQLGKDQPFFDCIGIDGVVKDALANLHIAFQESPTATIVVSSLPNVLGDQAQLVRLFQNLIANSLKFRSSEALKIDISANVGSSEVEFAIRDNGIGIDPRFRDRVFKLFQRLNHKFEYDGSGIGLSVCKKIVEHHGGRIWVEDSVKGCEIRFTLQFARSESDQKVA